MYKTQIMASVISSIGLAAAAIVLMPAVANASGWNVHQQSQRYCPQVYDPVCGKDGKTYSNQCVAHTRDAKIAHKGECRDQDDHDHYTEQRHYRHRYDYEKHNDHKHYHYGNDTIDRKWPPFGGSFPRVRINPATSHHPEWLTKNWNQNWSNAWSRW